LFLSLKKEIIQIPVTLDLFHLPAYALNYQNIILYTQMYQNICKNMKFYMTTSMVFVPIEAVTPTAVNDFDECLNKGGQCDVLTLDFSKVFDKVPHVHLYQKFSHYGIRGPILSWLQAF